METKAKSILFADDEPFYNQGMREELEDAGYRVQGVINGKGTLEVLNSGAEVNLIILDIMMPSGTPEIVSKGGRLTGVRLCEYIRRTLGLRTPIIFHTVVEDEKVHIELRKIEKEFGITPNIMVKPISPQELLKEVRKLIGNPS